MGVYLDVRYSTQLTAGAGGIFPADPTGCWLHSVSMLLTYFGQPLLTGLPELHVPSMTPAQLAAVQALMPGTTPVAGHLAIGSAAGNAALTAAGFPGVDAYQLLADREGLTPVAQCGTSHVFTAAELEQLLRNSGPIVFHWRKTAGTQTYGHASVLIGVARDNRHVIYHDPENAPNARMNVTDFNARRRVFSQSMNRKRVVNAAQIRPLPAP
jgi:hypothetical protein